MHSSFLIQEHERIRKDHKIIGSLWLFVGVIFIAVSFLPSHLAGFGSICIGGFGVIVIGLTYLLTGRSLDQKVERWRGWANLFGSICALATIIILVLDNAPIP